MRKFYICLLLIGCSNSFTDPNEFYHRFSNKPHITEVVIGNGSKKITAHNPLEVPVEVFMECDDKDKYHKVIKAYSRVSFEIKSDLTSQSCMTEYWVVK